MTADLVAWLLGPEGPFAADEAAAREALDLAKSDPENHPHSDWYANNADSSGDAIVAMHPTRALAECAAKRAIVEAYQEAIADYEEHKDDPHVWVSAHDHTVRGEVVRLLAQPYAGREGWRDEWAT